MMASQLAPIDPEDAKQITANDLVESDKLAKLARMRQLYGDLSDDPEWRKEWRRLFPEAAAEYLRAEWFGDDDALKSPPFLQRPDLHVLIAKYGAFSKIPPEAWAEHDAKMERFRRAVREGWPYPLGGIGEP